MFKKKNVVHLDQEAWEKKVKRRRIIVIVLLAGILVGIIASHLTRNVIIQGSAYKKAEAALASGNLAEGIDMFSLMRGYKDAGKRAADAAYKECGSDYDFLKTAKPGDVIEFGHYEQDGTFSNGAEPIEWIVYLNEGGAMYLLSANVLDQHAYNAEQKDVTWENCDLRAWLNSDFLNEAFTEKERLLVAATRNTNPNNTVSGVNGGADTEDKVFVPSISELTNIASSNPDWVNIFSMYSYPTKQAVNNGVEKAIYGTASWWIRTPGTDASSASVCDSKGEPKYSKRVNYQGIGVRPAIWLLTYENNG